MKHVFENPLQRPLQHEPGADQNEAAARFLLQRVTTMVNELDTCAGAINADAPSTARYLRFVTRQFAGLALTAVENWPNVRR